MVNLNDREEAFAKAFVLNGGNATEAYRESHPKSKAKATTQHEEASKMAKRPHVRTRITQLKKQAKQKAEEKFTVTVEQRLKWLNDIVKMGMGEWEDKYGNRRSENLAAAKGAIETLNDMLGTVDGKDTTRQSFNLTLRVEDASGSE